LLSRVCTNVAKQPFDMDPTTDDETLPHDLLRSIIQERQSGGVAKDLEKTIQPATRPQDLPTPTSPSARRHDDHITDEENLMKVMARRSHDIAISNDDLYLGPEEGVTVDFGPEPEEEECGVPGAYSGGPGTSYQRLEKSTVPQNVDDSEFQIESMDDPVIVEHAKIRAGGWPRWKVVLLILGLLLVVLATVLPLVLLLGDEDAEDPPMNGTMNHSLEEFFLDPNLSEYTLESLKVPFSYQSRAYQVAQQNFLWESYEPWRKRQKFAMLCVHFALDEAFEYDYHSDYMSWRKFELLNECDWQLGRQQCNEDGEIQAIYYARDRQNLRGLVPPEVALLTHLRSIHIFNVNLIPHLESLLPPTTVEGLPVLEVLELSNSKLQGSIPSLLGRLTALTRLNLGDNQLTSSIPTELGLLTNLTSLLLERNDLNGTIPEELGSLSMLQNFTLGNNTNLEPSIPKSFCEEEHGSMEQFTTDWCRSMEDCCESV
jgi:Leucine rich repeat